jgi:Glycosyl transferases group 1
MLDRIHAIGLKTFSYHLDVYFGLRVWDHRDDLVGQHPSWKVQHFFSTVGSKDELFKQRGVNHHWLPPGVVDYGCYEGKFQPSLAVDVGFAGSVSYHPEYDFRVRMVKALQGYYGPRFRVFQGYRESSLNDLYASVKVMVGDHCFAGEPYYWSDRLPETCGRGGFIVYPRTQGLTIPVVTYAPQDVDDLIKKVDTCLVHAQARETFRKVAFEHVKAHDTYTQRLKKILEVLGVA